MTSIFKVFFWLLLEMISRGTMSEEVSYLGGYWSNIGKRERWWFTPERWKERR